MGKSETGNLRITASRRGRIIRFDIRDDGRGFDPKHPGQGFGLVGMRERVEMLGGKLIVESAPGKGLWAGKPVRVTVEFVPKARGLKRALEQRRTLVEEIEYLGSGHGADDGCIAEGQDLEHLPVVHQAAHLLSGRCKAVAGSRADNDVEAGHRAGCRAASARSPAP